MSYIHTLEDDEVKTLDVKKTWKCQACGKLSTGFVVPFGRCYLCGGELQTVQGYTTDNPTKVALVSEAYQRELEMRTFYELALERCETPAMKDILEEMALKEQDHIEELEEKYHVKPPEELGRPETRRLLAERLFAELVETEPAARVLEIYDLAIRLEIESRDLFTSRAEEATGLERALYREFAAEEEDHVAILETERRNFIASRRE